MLVNERVKRKKSDKRTMIGAGLKMTRDAFATSDVELLQPLSQ
jgi:hypothetical protein